MCLTGHAQSDESQHWNVTGFYDVKFAWQRSGDKDIITQTSGLVLTSLNTISKGAFISYIFVGEQPLFRPLGGSVGP